MWQTIVAVAILVLILGGALFYIYKEKKKGKRCIGCPDSGMCGKSSCTSCEQECCYKKRNP